jgi:small subunit ribosomal protein S4e
MPKKHLKSIAVPKTWHVPRKKTVFVTRPYPGAHPMPHSMPLNIVMKELIKCAQTTKEVRHILERKQVLVDGVRRDEYKLPVGLMDAVSLPDVDEHYRVVLDSRGKIAAVPIKKDEAAMKPCRVMGKTVLGKGKFQLNLSGGRNLLVAKADYAVGDTLLLSLPKQEVKQHLKLEKGALVYLIGGSHIGETGTVEEMADGKIRVKADSASYETPKRYAFVVGKDKPAITLKASK